MQLAQLIGYSLSGYSELSYVDDDSYGAAEKMAEGKTRMPINTAIQFIGALLMAWILAQCYR